MELRISWIKNTCTRFESKFFLKGDYARKRASDSKHLPAEILNLIFFCEYTGVMLNIV